MSKRIIVSLIAAIALAVGALPAGAGTATPTGVRLGVLGGFTERAILADTAFYIQQGFVVDDPASGCNPCDTAIDVQQSSFTVSVNGVRQQGFVIQTFSDTRPRTLVSKFYLYNFASGLPVGTYTLHIEFAIRGQVVLARDLTIYSLASCENGTTNGLLCAPPPA
jgi:hypothetical protein